MPRLKKNVSLNKRNSTRINVTCIVGKEKKKKNCALFCVVLMPPPVILNANAPFLLEIEASNKNGKLLPYSFCSKRYSNLNTHFDQAMKIRIFIIYPNEVPTKLLYSVSRILSFDTSSQVSDCIIPILNLNTGIS